MPTKLQLTILDSKVKLREISPKFLSFKGGQELSMRLDFNKIFGKESLKKISGKGSQKEKVDPEKHLSNILKENFGNLMIAFKQIKATGPTPNFKNLRNNSVIDNNLFLKQKMVLSRQHLKGDGLLEVNNRQSRITITESSFLGKENKKFKSNISQSSNSPQMMNNLSVLKRTANQSKRSFKESRLGDITTEEPGDESSGWKLVDAKFNEGTVSCCVPEIDLESGELIMFNKQGIMKKIKANDFNSSGRKLLDEVTQWLHQKSYLKEQSKINL
jgi:hypothetical protein